jgi:hypothetical protein
MDLKVRTASGGDFVRPDNGYYLLRFDGLEDAGEWDNFEKTKKINKLRMVLAAFNQQTRQPILLTEGEHAGEQMVIKPLMTASGHIKSTLYQFASVIIGREPEEDEDIGELLAECIGRVVVGQVGNDQNQKPGKLKVLMPDMVGGATAAAPAQTEQVAPETATAQVMDADTSAAPAVESAIPAPPPLPGAAV